MNRHGERLRNIDGTGDAQGANRVRASLASANSVEASEAAAAGPIDMRYGMFPQQVQGLDRAGRPFYFRHRCRAWELYQGPSGRDPDYLSWCDEEQLVAASDGDADPVPDEIDEILSANLGSGWVAVVVVVPRYTTGACFSGGASAGEAPRV